MKLQEYERADCSEYRDPPLATAETMEALEVALVRAWASDQTANQALDKALRNPKVAKPLVEAAKARKAKKIEQVRVERKAEAERKKQEAERKLKAQREAEAKALKEKEAQAKAHALEQAQLALQTAEAEAQLVSALNNLGDREHLQDLEALAQALEPPAPPPKAPKPSPTQPTAIARAPSAEDLLWIAAYRSEEPMSEEDWSRLTAELDEETRLALASARSGVQWPTVRRFFRKVWRVLNYELW